MLKAPEKENFTLEDVLETDTAAREYVKQTIN